MHRVVITAILLAAKFFDDAYYNNAYYAKVGGVLVSEMNSLEVEFLFRINFSLHVKPEVFEKYQDELVSHAVGAGLENQQQLQQHTQQITCVSASSHVTDQEKTTYPIAAPSQQIQQQHKLTQQPTFRPVPVANGTVQSSFPQSHAPSFNVVVTPSPPQTNVEYQQQSNIEYQQQHQQQNIYFIPNQQSQLQHVKNQLQNQQPQEKNHQQPTFQPSVFFEQHQQHSQDPSQQQQQMSCPLDVPNRFSQMLSPKIKPNNPIAISSTKDMIFATCCPYGGRLTSTSPASGILNTVVYQ